MADGDQRGRWLGTRWLGGLLNVGAVAAAVGAYLFSAGAGRASGAERTQLLVTGAVLAGAVVALGAAKQLRDARRIRTAADIAVAAEEELSVTLNGALAPITSYLGEMADAYGPPVGIIAGQLRQAVVDAVVRLTGEGTRSAFYALDERGDRLVREVYAGRATLPRLEFVAGSPDGDAVLDLVRRADLVFVPDVLVDPMVIPSTAGAYRTVIAVAVTAGSRRLGMLTVDSPQPGDLSATDVELVRVLANLLASGLAQA